MSPLCVRQTDLKCHFCLEPAWQSSIFWKLETCVKNCAQSFPYRQRDTVSTCQYTVVRSGNPNCQPFAKPFTMSAPPKWRILEIEYSIFLEIWFDDVGCLSQLWRQRCHASDSVEQRSTNWWANHENTKITRALGQLEVSNQQIVRCPLCVRRIDGFEMSYLLGTSVAKQNFWEAGGMRYDVACSLY